MAHVIRITTSETDPRAIQELPVKNWAYVGEEGARRGLAVLPGGQEIPVYTHPENGDIWYEQLGLDDWKASQEGTIALYDWHLRARGRIRDTTTKRSVDPYTVQDFQKGKELELIAWGRARCPIDRSNWWTSYDIDGAYIFDAHEVEILAVLDEMSPFHPLLKSGETTNEL